MKSVVIATTTFYKSTDELRFHLACDIVRKAAAGGYKVVIVDASPAKEIADSLRAQGALIYFQQSPGMGPGRREAFSHAYEVGKHMGAEVIFWTEPEKVDLICSIPKIVKGIRATVMDIVIPRRSEASWQTWPKFQRESEKNANKRYNEIFGTDNVDVMFGPVAFSMAVAGEFISCTPQTFGVDDTYIQHYAPIIARYRYGANVVRVVEVDMTYPPMQRSEEEGAQNNAMLEKRRWQAKSLTEAYQKLAAKCEFLKREGA